MRFYFILNKNFIKCWTLKFIWNQNYMSNQVVFQTWSWYHNNSDSCEILSGQWHYTKNIHRVTPELYWFLYAVFCHKINHFLSQYHVYYKTWNLDSQIFPTMCVLSRLQKRSDFLKQATKPQSIYIYIYIYMCVCFYISIYTPKRATYPLRYKHLETD